MRTEPNPLIISEKSRESLFWHVIVFSVYLIFGVIFTWPLALHMNDSVIQRGELFVDTGQNIWNFWWIQTALQSGENPFVTKMVFFPETVNLLYQSINIPDALLVVIIPSQPVFAFNTAVLLSFGLTGYFAYRIVRNIVQDRFVAMIAAFTLVCSPFRIQKIHAGILELFATHWLVLYVFLLMSSLARSTPSRILYAAFCLFITTLACRYYGLYAAVYSVFHVVLAALLSSRQRRQEILLTGAGIGITWTILLTPLVLWIRPLNVEIEDWYIRQVFHSVALVDLISMNVFHPLWGSFAREWLSQYHPYGMESGANLGLGVWLLIVIALCYRWHRAWPWGLLLLIMLLLGMGPQLRLTREETSFPGLFLILDILPFFRNASRPSLFVALMLIPVIVLVALGITSLWSPRNSGSRGISRFLACTIIILTIIEYVVEPWPLKQVNSAPENMLLNADPVPGAVLELPPRLDQSEGLLNQICHGRPLVGGYLARTPLHSIVSSSSATRNLWQLREPTPDIVTFDPAAELASLGIRFIVLDLNYLSREEQERLHKQLAVSGIESLLIKDNREIYTVNPAFARPVIVLGSGWYETEHEGMQRWRWMGEEAEIILLAREQALVVLSWKATAYRTSRTLSVWQEDYLLSTLDVPTAPYSQIVTFQLIIPPGQTILRLKSTTDREPDGRHLSLSIRDLHINTLSTTNAWDTTVQRLEIPPTRKPIKAPPCR